MLIGQLDIKVAPIVKVVFFDLFLFATGYKVGPQFFRGLGRNALPQVALTVVLCVTSLVVTVAAAKIFGYDCGTAAGLMAGAFTESTVIGTAGDTINRLDLPAAEKTRLLNNIPVAYAVCYLVGTGFVVWFLSSLAPRLLRVDLKAESRKLEAELAGGAGSTTGRAVRLSRVGHARLPDRRRRLGGQDASPTREVVRARAGLRRADPRAATEIVEALPGHGASAAATSVAIARPPPRARRAASRSASRSRTGRSSTSRWSPSTSSSRTGAWWTAPSRSSPSSTAAAWCC